jgi:energy-coupling factor transport system permease protein
VSSGTSLFFYRRLASPLHAARPGVAAVWALAVSLAALLLDHPLALIALLVAVLGAAAGAGVGHELRRALRIVLIIGVPIVAVNVLVSREGLTVFARLGDLGPFGQGNLTTEALVYGAVVALKVAIVILVATLASLTVDPDGLLRIVRRLSFRSALTATLAIRMLPLLVADGQRIAEAQRTRPGGAPRGPRARISLLTALVAGALDRAMDVAATLEVRGFATGRRAPRSARAWSRHDLAFSASAVALLGLASVGASEVHFAAYPLVRMPLTAASVAVCAGLLTAVLLPFGDRRGVEP